MCDPLQRPYVELEVELVDNQAEFAFQAAGVVGVHYIYLIFPGETRWSRYLNFEVHAKAAWKPATRFRPSLPVHPRPYAPGTARVSYAARQVCGLYLGRHLALRRHLAARLDLRPARLPPLGARHGLRGRPLSGDAGRERHATDGIERDGHTWRVGLESDVEYILTLAVWQTWQASGDDDWLRTALPHLERALTYTRSDPKHWDAEHNLVKRQHSCDTWDFDIDGATDHGDRRHVIATCDQSGYALAFPAMSRMYAALGEDRPGASGPTTPQITAAGPPPAVGWDEVSSPRPPRPDRSRRFRRDAAVGHGQYLGDDARPGFARSGPVRGR